MLKAFARSVHLPRMTRIEKEIGCRLAFRGIPGRFIQGWMRWDMTGTWKRAGLDVRRGANYFTMGRVVNGVSSRFDPRAPEYQAWLGGYTVAFPAGSRWSIEDHFKLAIADQNSWLGLYGDPHPATTVAAGEFSDAGELRVGRYSGVLYEGGCATHSDVGGGWDAARLRLACAGMAAVFDLSDPRLGLQGSHLRPKGPGGGYEPVALRGYVAVIDVGEDAKAILYANGTEATFPEIRGDLLAGMRSCEIVDR